MSYFHKTINRFLTWTLILTSAFMVVNLIMYAYTRKVVEAGPPQTTQKVYARGEEVFVTGHTKIFVTGTATNDVRLQCGNSQYFVKQLQLDTRPIDVDYTFSLGIIPFVTAPSPPSCKIVTVTTHYVKYFLMFTRAYQVTFETNEFIVTSNIKE